MVLFVKYKNGHVENYKIKSFTMVNSTIRIKTDCDILYLNYGKVINDIVDKNKKAY